MHCIKHFCFVLFLDTAFQFSVSVIPIFRKFSVSRSPRQPALEVMFPKMEEDYPKLHHYFTKLDFFND